MTLHLPNLRAQAFRARTPTKKSPEPEKKPPYQRTVADYEALIRSAEAWLVSLRGELRATELYAQADFQHEADEELFDYLYGPNRDQSAR